MFVVLIVTLSAGMDFDFHAIDISDSANKLYEKSFGDKVNQLDICSLDDSFFSHHCFDVWTMSPPCQPYTRQRNSKCLEGADCRNNALSHLINMIDSLNFAHLPRVVILENVRHFAGSDACMDISTSLLSRGFFVRAFLISPRQLGFPNERTRFYMIAQRTGDVPNEISKDFAEKLARDVVLETSLLTEDNNEDNCFKAPLFSSYIFSSLNNYSNLNPLFIEDEVLAKPSTHCVDLVWLDETENMCCEPAPHSVNIDNYSLGIGAKNLGEAADAKLTDTVLMSLRKEVKRNNYSENTFVTDNTSSTNQEINHKDESDQVHQSNSTRSHLCPLAVDDSLYASPRKKYTLCFTKAYGRFFDGTGSCLVTSGLYEIGPEWTDRKRSLSKYCKNNNNREIDDDSTDESPPVLAICENPLARFSKRLRYFHPREVARMMGFKDSCEESGNDLTRVSCKLKAKHLCLPSNKVKMCSNNHNVNCSDTNEDCDIIENNIKQINCLCSKYELALPNVCEWSKDQTKGRGSRQGDLSFRSYWALLGNSLNPQVVGKLLSITGISTVFK